MVQSTQFPSFKYLPSTQDVEHIVSVTLEQCCKTARAPQEVQFEQVPFLTYCPSLHDAEVARLRANSDINKTANFSM